jgi:hypothetical protein
MRPAPARQRIGGRRGALEGIIICLFSIAPSTTLRVVPLPRFAGEEPAPPLLILPPFYGGRGPPKAVEGALQP